MNRTSLLLTAMVMGSSNVAVAGSESGFYIGGSLGQASSEYSDSLEGVDFDLDDENTTLKFFGGYNFGIIPLLNLAVEATYMDFGSYESDSDVIDVEMDLSGFSVAGVVGFDLGPIGIFGKTGMLSADQDIRVAVSGLDPYKDSDSGSEVFYGVGAKMQFGSFAVRGEYEFFDIGGVDIGYLSVGGSYTF